MARAAALLLTGFAIAWVALVVAAPVALAHGYMLLPAIVYQAAGLICHQRPERSFHLAGVQLPVCARCFGLYLSGAGGALAACMAGLAGSSRVLTRHAAVLALAAVPTAVTVALEWADLSHPGSVARALAAVPLGGVAGWLFVTLLAVEGAPNRAASQVRYHS